MKTQPVIHVVVATLMLTIRPSHRLHAQRRDTTRLATQSAPAAVDSSKGIKPVGALWRSLLVPGWGQAVTGRNVTGAAFVMWEGVTAMMTLRAVHERRYLTASGSDNVAAKRQQVQDWVVLWAFNHLFAGAEAFVSAHLQDFPKELKLEAVPTFSGGSIAIRLRL